jgi:RNA polymerase sigma-70 factor (ECF subfamily)
MEASDTELIKRAQNGDMLAFDAIVIKHKDSMFNALRKMGASRQDAEDVLQNTFYKMYRALQSYNYQSKLTTWMYTILFNEWRSQLRSQRRRRLVSLFARGGRNHDGEEREFDLVDQQADVPGEVHRRMLIQDVEQAMSRLPGHLREVLVLREIQELDYAEIARILEVPVGTVKSRINRARNQIINQIKRGADESLL